MHRLHIAVTALLILSGARPVVAQTTVAGTWITEFPINLRVINGVESSDGTGKARVSMQLKGDSVLGTWQEITTGGRGRARSLRGVKANGRVRLETDPPDERVLNVNGDEQRVRMRTVYDFALTGDALEGEEHGEGLDHSMVGPSRRFSAKREPAK